MENHARLNTAIAGKKDIADSATRRETPKIVTK